MERRLSSRISFRTTAAIFRGEEPSIGEIRDISRHGFFITTRCGYQVGQNVLVSVILHEAEITLSMTVPCAITRTTDTGIGCSSQYMEPESLLFMSSLVHTHKDTPSRFFASFFGYLNSSGAFAGS